MKLKKRDMKKRKQVKVISVSTEGKVTNSQTDMRLPYIILKDALIKTELDSNAIDANNSEEIVKPDHPP